MIIAERSLKVHQDGAEKDVAIRLFAPRQEGGDWSCKYEIDWPEGTRKFAAHGIDAVQAIELALKMIGSEIYTSDYHKSKLLVWEAPAKGYGFPVAKTIRDLLIGDDKDYF